MNPVLFAQPDPAGLGVGRDDGACSEDLPLGLPTDTLITAAACYSVAPDRALCPQVVTLETLAACAILRRRESIVSELMQAVHRGHQHERGITGWRPGQHGLHALHLRGPARLALCDDLAPALRLWAIESWLCGEVAEKDGVNLIDAHTELATQALSGSWTIRRSKDFPCAYSPDAPLWAIWDVAPVALGPFGVGIHPGAEFDLDLARLARKLSGTLDGRLVRCVLPADAVHVLVECGLPQKG